MAKVQKQFTDFHKAIKLNWNDEEATLRDKRDIVLNLLRERLKKRFEDEKKPVPTFTERMQGSYAMRTGIKPLDKDYDLDIALLFNIAKDDHKPLVVKEWVHTALDGHTKEVKIRRPCVTVWYMKGEEPKYHLDLAVYSAGTSNGDGKTYLAKGFSGSAEENKVWYESDPEALVSKVNERHEGEDREQFRRVICYLKRWKDEKFRSEGESAPRGIALTAAAYQWFQPSSIIEDPLTNKREYNDRAATCALVKSMLSNFAMQFHGSENETADRMSVALPIPPYADPFDRMSNKQMESLKKKLEALRDALEAAETEVDPVVACENLQKQFGDDFPVPPKEKTGQRGGSPIIVSGSSA